MTFNSQMYPPLGAIDKVGCGEKGHKMEWKWERERMCVFVCVWVGESESWKKVSVLVSASTEGLTTAGCLSLYMYVCVCIHIHIYFFFFSSSCGACGIHMQVSDVFWCFIYCFAQTPVIGRVSVALKLWQIQHIYDMMQLLLRINSGAAALLVTNTNIAVIAAIVSRSTTAALKIWGNCTRCTARLASNRPSTSFPHRPLSAHHREISFN